MKWCAVVSVLAFSLVGMPSVGHAGWFFTAQEVKGWCQDRGSDCLGYISGVADSAAGRGFTVRSP